MWTAGFTVCLTLSVQERREFRFFRCQDQSLMRYLLAQEQRGYGNCLVSRLGLHSTGVCLSILSIF